MNNPIDKLGLMGAGDSGFIPSGSLEEKLDKAYEKGLDDAMAIVAKYCYETPIGRMAHVGLILHTAESEIIKQLQELKKKS